ncbi:hypothetical protein [Pseudomaricurvus sp. HS19]|uniref:hypothetical protein n=1 Tax=Pseudomaricurvus sp. HS19 TaxID=2692626 RepID=UPI0013697830|nr:hypothetical protein [Pseudomaricurvus sp. HS19]MYM62288.1 hypothetical protein [Pseudomaricurvus sp. HS19]
MLNFLRPKKPPAAENIWSLRRDKSIRRLLLILREQFGQQAFEIEHNVDTSQYAIFVRHPQEPELRAYLFTYGQDPNRYGIHLEYVQENLVDSLYDVFEGLTSRQLADILSSHFNLLPLPQKTHLRAGCGQ